MSYTPTSWSTGDTITAAALNKIENGIASASGGQTPLFIVTRTNAASYSLILFTWGIAKYNNGSYEIISPSYTASQYCPPGNGSTVSVAPFPLPISDNLFLVVYNFTSSCDIVSQSGIDLTQITLSTPGGGLAYGFKITSDYILTISG